MHNITIYTTATDQNYKDGIDEEPGQLIRINPFKKLFPLDSILKPFRPVLPGVKYYINLTSDHEGSNKFYDYSDFLNQYLISNLAYSEDIWSICAKHSSKKRFVKKYIFFTLVFVYTFFSIMKQITYPRT